MRLQDAVLRRSVCTAALRCVLDHSEVEEAVRELEDCFQGLDADAFSEERWAQSAVFQRVLRDWGRGHLLTEFALQRLSQALMQASQADPDQLPEDPWCPKSVPLAASPVRLTVQKELEQSWHLLPIHTFQIVWQTSWQGRALYQARQWLHTLDRWLLQRMEENYGQGG